MQASIGNFDLRSVMMYPCKTEEELLKNKITEFDYVKKFQGEWDN